MEGRCGRVVATSVLRPQAGEAGDTLVFDLHTHDDQFQSTTNDCMRLFSRRLVKNSSNFFDDQKLCPHVNSHQYHHALNVFAQQRAIVAAFSDIVKDNGLVWEQLQNSFAPAQSRKRAWEE